MKKILCAILSAVLMLSVLPTHAFAEAITAAESAQPSATAEWLTNYDYYLGQIREDTTDLYAILENYKGNETEIVVPSRVVVEGVEYPVALGNNAQGIWRKGKDSITSITFEEGVKLGENATWSMFEALSKLKHVNTEILDTTGQTSFYGMFFGCENLCSVDVSNWNMSSATNISFMFYHCEKLKSLDLHKWDTSNVTNMNDLFARCYNMEKLNVSGWSTSNVTNFDGIFSNMFSLTSIDLSSFDMSKASSDAMADSFFNRNGRLKTIKTPKNLNYKIDLDFEYKTSKGKKYKTLPMNSNKSITLSANVKKTKAPKITSLKSSKGWLDIKWTKVKAEEYSDTYYEVEVAEDAKFVNTVGKFSNLDKNEQAYYNFEYYFVKNTTRVSGLERGKTYYVRVRASQYQKLVSDWSKVKKIKIK